MTGVVAKRKPPAAGIGRKRGNPNKLTKSAKEAFELAFAGLDGVDGLIAWARKHRTQFYRLYARLIPPGALNNGQPLVNITLPSPGASLSATEVARLYRDALGRPDMLIPEFTIAAPVPSGDVLEALPPDVVEVNALPVAAVDPRVEPIASDTSATFAALAKDGE